MAKVKFLIQGYARKIKGGQRAVEKYYKHSRLDCSEHGKMFENLN